MLSYIDHLILLINSMYILITVQSQLELGLAQLSPSLFLNIVAGWGIYDDYCKGGSKQPYLQEKDMEILPPDICRNFEGYFNMYNKSLGSCVKEHVSFKRGQKYGLEVIADSVLCAKHATGGTCIGDSGGPLTVKESDSEGDRHVLVGVSARGHGCGVVSFLLWNYSVKIYSLGIDRFQPILI